MVQLLDYLVDRCAAGGRLDGGVKAYVLSTGIAPIKRMCCLSLLSRATARRSPSAPPISARLKKAVGRFVMGLVVAHRYLRPRSNCLVQPARRPPACPPASALEGVTLW